MQTNADISKIEGIVLDKLASSFSQRLGTSEILLDESAQQDIQQEFNTHPGYLYDLTGIKTLDLSIYNMHPSKKSLEIMRIPIKSILETQSKKLSGKTEAEILTEHYLPLVRAQMPDATPKEQMDYALKIVRLESLKSVAADSGRNIIIFEA